MCRRYTPVRFSVLAIALAGLLSSCSLTRGDVDACATNNECRVAFGLGATCGEDGFCESSELDPRCSVAFPTNPDTPNLIFIGTIVDGSLETHVARARAVELAVRDASESGGVDGATFGLVVCSNALDSSLDDLSQDDAAVRVATFLQDVVGTPVIVGPPSSNATREVFRATDDVLIISPSASSDELTTLEPPASDAAPGRLWRTTASDGPQVDSLVEDILGRGVERLAIVHQAGAYGDVLAADVMEGLDATVMVSDFRFDTDGRLAELQAIVGRSDVEEVLVISSRTEDSIGFLRAADSSMFFDEKRFLLTDAAANADLVSGLAGLDVVSRIRGTRPAPADDATRDGFYNRYQLTFDENARPFSFATNAYDAGWLALFGIAWARLQEDGVLGPAEVGRGLRSLSRGANVAVQMSSWETVVDAFGRGESVDVSGASGTLDFDPITEETRTEFQLWVIGPDGIEPE